MATAVVGPGSGDVCPSASEFFVERQSPELRYGVGTVHLDGHVKVACGRPAGPPVLARPLPPCPLQLSPRGLCGHVVLLQADAHAPGPTPSTSAGAAPHEMTGLRICGPPDIRRYLGPTGVEHPQSSRWRVYS